MGLFDKLFGRSQPKQDAPKDAAGIGRVIPKLPGADRTKPRGADRPFDIVAEALQAWQAGETMRAEKLFKEGVAAYRRREPDGLDFALGRYGAFLIEQERKDEAMRVLEEAVSRKTDIPAIWSDYVRVIADSRDLDAFKQAIERMAASGTYKIEPEFLLAHARRAQRENATAFAEALARWVVERGTREGDTQGGGADSIRAVLFKGDEGVNLGRRPLCGGCTPGLLLETDLLSVGILERWEARLPHAPSGRLLRPMAARRDRNIVPGRRAFRNPDRKGRTPGRAFGLVVTRRARRVLLA